MFVLGTYVNAIEVGIATQRRSVVSMVAIIFIIRFFMEFPRYTRLPIYRPPATRKNTNQDGLEARFGYLFQNDAHVIAAIVQPRFKLNWLYFDATKQEKYSDVIKKLMDTNCAEVFVNPPQQSPQVVTPAGTPVEDHLEFPVPVVKSACIFEQYLNDSKEDLKMLDDYPTVKNLFEFNTPIPSSLQMSNFLI